MDTIERGRHAERLLSDEVLAEAFDGVKAALVRSLESAPLQDVDLHHRIALSLQLLKQVRSQLQQFVATGQAEQARNSANSERVRSLVGY